MAESRYPRSDPRFQEGPGCLDLGHVLVISKMLFVHFGGEVSGGHLSGAGSTVTFLQQVALQLNLCT